MNIRQVEARRAEAMRKEREKAEPYLRPLREENKRLREELAKETSPRS